VCVASVTEAALKLQRTGLIRYSRGHIVVLDRQALAKRACECYSVVKKEYERLLPRVEGYEAVRRSDQAIRDRPTISYGWLV
jgi:hypothetical protein